MRILIIVDLNACNQLTATEIQRSDNAVGTDVAVDSAYVVQLETSVPGVRSAAGRLRRRHPGVVQTQQPPPASTDSARADPAALSTDRRTKPGCLIPLDVADFISLVAC